MSESSIFNKFIIKTEFIDDEEYKKYFLDKNTFINLLNDEISVKERHDHLSPVNRVHVIIARHLSKRFDHDDVIKMYEHAKKVEGFW